MRLRRPLPAGRWRGDAVAFVDPGDLEGAAVEAYERHKLDPSIAVPTVRLARLELGPEAIVRAPMALSGPSALFWHRGARRIAVRRNLPREYALFFIGHELAHLVLERAGYVGEDLEAACDYLGAALGAPRPAAHAVFRAHGFDLAEGARVLRTTGTGWVLRIGEVEHIPLVAVSPRTVRVRGPEDWVWGDERAIRAEARSPRPGLRKVEIVDGRGRFALVAQEG